MVYYKMIICFIYKLVVNNLVIHMCSFWIYFMYPNLIKYYNIILYKISYCRRIYEKLIQRNDLKNIKCLIRIIQIIVNSLSCLSRNSAQEMKNGSLQRHPFSFISAQSLFHNTERCYPSSLILSADLDALKVFDYLIYKAFSLVLRHQKAFWSSFHLLINIGFIFIKKYIGCDYPRIFFYI